MPAKKVESKVKTAPAVKKAAPKAEKVEAKVAEPKTPAQTKTTKPETVAVKKSVGLTIPVYSISGKEDGEIIFVKRSSLLFQS